MRASVIKGRESAVCVTAYSPTCPRQLAKLGSGLLGSTAASAGGVPADAAAEETCVAPRMLKMLVGRGHPDFSSARQQDAQEYMQHLLELLARAERASPARLGGAALPRLAGLLTHSMEERIEADSMVCYRTVAGCTEVSLQIPLEAATNKAAVEAYTKRASLAKRQRLEAAAEEGALECLRAAPQMARLLAAAKADPASVGPVLQDIAKGAANAPFLALVEGNQDEFRALLNGTATPAPPRASPPVETEEEAVVPLVPFEACLVKFAGAEPLESFRGRHGATKTVRYEAALPLDLSPTRGACASAGALQNVPTVPCRAHAPLLRRRRLDRQEAPGARARTREPRPSLDA